LPVKRTTEELHLHDPVTNEIRRIAIDAIDEEEEARSIMPQGLTNSMRSTELRDLIRFLSELRAVTQEYSQRHLSWAFFRILPRQAIAPR